METSILIFTGIMGALLTWFINNHKAKGAVRASALPSLLVGLFFYCFPHVLPAYLSRQIPLVFIGSSFVGMVSINIISKWIYVAISGLIFSLIYLNTGEFFKGFGGALGTTACIAVLVAIGLAKLIEHGGVKKKNNLESTRPGQDSDILNKKLSLFKSKAKSIAFGLSAKPKKILSYLWPITKKVDSDFSGKLEITWIDGKKVLDTKNANYSYGTLQHVLENGLKRIDFSQIDSVLILGLGGGSVVKSLQEKFNFYGSIQAVEIDQKIIDIAKTEFDLSAIKNLKIHQEDAFHFVEHSKQQYDLIIIDLFIDTEIPTIFLSEKFCLQLSNICQNSLLFNLGFRSDAADRTKKVTDFFENNPNFEVFNLQKVEGINRLLIAFQRTVKPFKY